MSGRVAGDESVGWEERQGGEWESPRAATERTHQLRVEAELELTPLSLRLRHAGRRARFVTRSLGRVRVVGFDCGWLVKGGPSGVGKLGGMADKGGGRPW